MAWLAGETLDSARLVYDTSGTSLTNKAPSAAATWEQWGAETIAFSNPGVPVKVIGMVSGRGSRSAASTVLMHARVGISFDNGTTWTYGPEPSANVGNLAGSNIRATIAAGHYRAGTPTGTVIVRAECKTDTDTNNTHASGFLNAEIVAQ